jgi:hypothetical protein
MGLKIPYQGLYAMIDRRMPFTRRRIVTFVLVYLVLPLAANQTAQAQVENIFEIRRVAVDVTAETATAAREIALAGGEATAFRRLLERLTLRSDHARLPELSRDEISAYVKDFSVAEEKVSAVRYIAVLNFRFKNESLRRLLINNHIPFAETLSKPVLVLPVYQAAGALFLFDDPNPWREAWRAFPEQDGLVPLVLPRGDLLDIAAIGPEQVLDGDTQRLDAIASRYSAGDTLVAHGTLRMNASGGSDLKVFVTRYGTAQVSQTMVKTFSPVVGESLQSLLTRAASELISQVDDNWKEDNQLQFGQQAVVAVTVRIGRLADWLKVREQLAGVAVISRIDLVLLSRDEVRVNLHYIGDQDQLALALEQADLIITREGDNWILGLSSAARQRGT